MHPRVIREETDDSPAKRVDSDRVSQRGVHEVQGLPAASERGGDDSQPLSQSIPSRVNFLAPSFEEIGTTDDSLGVVNPG